MLVTVAICTLNRAESLRRTLNSIAALCVPRDLDWEVVVVNNGSGDDTDEVIKSFTGRLPIRLEFEPERGHSSARNHAVDAAKGKYIVWTDDDVIVDPGWLAAYLEAFRRWPEAALFGGPITPKYSEPTPKWVIECQSIIAPMAAFRDFGPEPLPLSIEGHRIPYGPSLAMRASYHRKFRFNPNLGRRPGQQRVCEETDVVGRVLQSGATGYWVPDARVEHCIGCERQTLTNVANFFASLGESAAFLDEANGLAREHFWFKAPRWVYRLLIQGCIGYHFHKVFSPPPIWMAYLKDYAKARGHIRYWWSTRGDVTPKNSSRRR